MRRVSFLTVALIIILLGLLVSAQIAGVVRAAALLRALSIAQDLPYRTIKYPDAIGQLQLANLNYSEAESGTYPLIRIPQGALQVAMMVRENSVETLCYRSDRDSSGGITVGDLLGALGDPDLIGTERPDFNGTMLLTLRYTERKAQAVAIIHGTWHELDTPDGPTESYQMTLDSPLVEICYSPDFAPSVQELIPWEGFFHQYPDFIQ